MNFINKRVAIISCMGVFCSGIFIFFNVRKQEVKASQVTIGILQTVSHPALDRAREGFVQELCRHFGDQCTFVVQNAEGSMSTAQTIAQSFHHNLKITAIVALGTLATQAASSVEKQKPVIFCAVTDPVSLGVVGPTSNVCGASDVVDVSISAQTIKSLFPHVQQVAMLFNPAEANSVSLVEKMETFLRQIEILPLLIGVNNEVEISSAVAMAVRKADVLWVPTDNTIANAMSMVGQLVLKAKKSLFICDNLLITDGVLASAGGVDYIECGRQAALLAVKVLKDNCRPAQLGVVNTPSSSIVVHKKTCMVLGIQMSKELSSHVIWAK